MGAPILDPQQQAKWKLFNQGPQNPLFQTPGAPSPTETASAAPAPTSQPATPPATPSQPPAAPSAANDGAALLYGQQPATKPPMSAQDFTAANPEASKAYMPPRPVGDFDTGAHPHLRRALATLFGGLAEFGGDINHHPGQGTQLFDRWAGQDAAQRQYDNPQNQEHMKAGALSQAYQAYLQHENERQKAMHERYVVPRSGGVFDTESGGYAPGAGPVTKPEAPHTVETGNGVLQFNDKTGKYDIPVGPPKAQAKTPSFEEQSYEEWHQSHPKGTRMQYEAEKARTTQKPEKEPRQMVIGPDGTVLELHPGDKVPAGSKTAAKYGEPTADEQRRADLAKNLNENFDQLEDIVSRRPELFGPLAGRWTELKGKFGSDDPDVAALQTLEHQIGMAQISAHGMRSAHGIEGASQSILNGFHSGPNAIRAAIKTARSSVGTFQSDVDQAKGEAPQGKPQGKSGPPQGATHTAMGSDGKKHYTNAQGQDLGIAQ
jgi:hypothetical protein